MSSVCTSSCIRDAQPDPRVPVRASYVNLYKWPESDAEFVRSMSFKNTSHGDHPRVVDSFSCRQIYLRSYPFSKEDEGPEKHRTPYCFGKFGSRDRNKRKCIELKRVKDVSWKAVSKIFGRLLSCTTSVDVADHHRKAD